MKSWFKKLRYWEEEAPEQDPIVSRSLAVPLAISSLLLILSLVWAFYEEGWGLRPWKAYQDEFREVYPSALRAVKPAREQEEQTIKSAQGYLDLQQQLQAAEGNIQSELQRLDQAEGVVRDRLQIITQEFANKRSQAQAKRYEVETTNSDSARGSLQQELDDLQASTIDFEFATGPETFTYKELEAEFNNLKQSQGELQGERVELLRRPAQLRRELDAYLTNRLSGPTSTQIDGLISQAENSGTGIRQIHNAEMGLVDRCESCHLAAREPITMTAADVGGNALFATHPRTELFGIHDPQVFGCSPCHNGNGIGTVSAEKAHGRYKHWMWPLYENENVEAGCIQCHDQDHFLEGADTVNAARVLFQNRGCQGCHPREGFDREPPKIRDVQKQLEDLAEDRTETLLTIERIQLQGDQAATNEEANRRYAEAEKLTVQIAASDADTDRLQARVQELLMEIKKVGPNLKEVRNKLRKEWIPIWIENPQAFRPNTKMPQFPLEPDEIQAISAFIWQSGLDGNLARQPPGDADRGKESFEKRGCLGCHSVGEGDSLMGGTFAANLSRVGEKANYDYLVRWVHNPRQRSQPYCPVHQRDISAADYASVGLPFEFDLENNQCPLGDHVLQVQNQVVMPSLRLSDQESRDVATYLMTLSRSESSYPAAPFMEDANLVEQGRFLVRHYGCAGCHEIAGLENEGKVGTDLTVEGSKPIERLDFALLTHDAKAEGWYDHKGFFERKLRDPSTYDQGKIKEPLEKLRMPNFHLTEEEIDQLTTFLLGSVETIIPEEFQYNPPDERRFIQEGWWLVKKYNCVGCHEFTAGQATDLEGLSFYQAQNAEKLPPALVGQGARANPEWLGRFLKNPALSTTDTDANGVRPYLDVRMPTFSLSDGEIQTLIRFFHALAKQPLPYLPQRIEPLDRSELTLARALFTSPAAPCLRCHATGDPATDSEKTAPNFSLVAERLKPDWTQRWIVHPELIRPGTAMPSGLFQWDGSRWVFALGRVPGLDDYEEDQADLVVRYMFQFTPQEQRRLMGR